MKKLFVFLSLIVFLISGCSFDVHVLTPAPAEATPPPVTPIAFHSAVPVSVSTEPPITGYTPDPTDSLFYAAYAVLDPANAPGRSAFPAGTYRIYVVWNYQNMRDGLTVKREWYLDGKLWLMREEPWDFAKYGAFGVVQDVSIYDENIGLPSGAYQLKMYIDGLLQPIGASTANGPELWLNFEVLPNGSITEAASPDFKWDAVVLNGNHLIVRDTNGAPTELFTGLEIPHFVWFPDSQHILYVNRDRSGQTSGTNRGIRDQLWVADIVRREIVLLYESDAMLGLTGGFRISSNGRFVATSEGSGDGDACFLSLSLTFFEMGADFTSIKVMHQKQFIGLPLIPDSSVYPSSEGTWQSNTEFIAPMKITCVTDESLAGNYVFDVASLKAVKK